MLTPPGSICKEIEKYLRRKEDEPDKPWADPSGSLLQSVDCRCRYCYAACDAIGKERDVRENKEKNSEAIVKNSVLELCSSAESENIPKLKEDPVLAEFRRSGLTFSQAGVSSELFIRNSE